MTQKLKISILLKNKNLIIIMLMPICTIWLCTGTKMYSYHENDLTQSVNVQRIEQLNKMCQTMGYTNTSHENLSDEQMEHLLIDKKHKFLYCYVPKVACTNWKRVLMMMTDQWNGTDALQIPATLAHSPGMFIKFSDLSNEERDDVLTNYSKFVIVRHPFERLLSAYRNKLEGSLPSSRYFQARIGRQIIKAFRSNPSNESLLYGHDVTFTEFVQYLLMPELNINKTYNEHWKPITDLCNPCIVRYNVIGKYETLIDDSALALHIIGVDNLTFPAGQKTSGTSELMTKYFDPFPMKITRNLYKVYEDDFKLFGYTLEDVFGLELA